MTRELTSISRGALLRDAVEILADMRISELPVLDPDGKPCGLIDITDVVGLLPPDEALSLAASVQGVSPDAEESCRTIPFPTPAQPDRH